MIDKDLTLPKSLALFNGEVQTIVFTRKQEVSSLPQTTYVTLDFEQAILPQIMEELYNRKLQSLMVEGGSILLQSFIDAGLWDEAYIEKSDAILGEGVKAPYFPKTQHVHIEKRMGKDFNYLKKQPV